MIPLFKPYMPTLPNINHILQSGQLAYGKYGREFERRLSDFLGVKDVIVTNSYNMAISVTLTTLGIGYGDEIILSPMACLASTQPLIASGIKVKWADVDPTTGTLDPDYLEKNITSKTKAIIHNHYCGYIGYIDEINAIGKKFSIPVIDDCIEAFGGTYKGKILGNVGTDATIFSFNPVRIPNTIDGGAVCFKDHDIAQTSLYIRDCGIRRAIFRDALGEISPLCDIDTIGYSATMSDVNAYIGIEQLNNVDELLLKQRRNAIYWDSFIRENLSDVKALSREEINPNYWVYGMLTPSKSEMFQKFRNLGYSASSVHLNNNCYSIFGEKTNLKGVNEFYSRFLAIPSGWWVNL